MSRDSSGGGPFTLIGVLISVMISIVMGVNLILTILGVDSPVEESTIVSQEVIDYLPSSFGGPTWAFVVLGVGLVGLVICWYVGRKVRLSILED